MYAAHFLQHSLIYLLFFIAFFNFYVKRARRRYDLFRFLSSGGPLPSLFQQIIRKLCKSLESCITLAATNIIHTAQAHTQTHISVRYMFYHHYFYFSMFLVRCYLKNRNKNDQRTTTTKWGKKSYLNYDKYCTYFLGKCKFKMHTHTQTHTQ